MKRLAGAFFIAGLLFLLSASAESYMAKSCDDISFALEMCADNIKEGDYRKALGVLEDINEKWKKNRFITGVVMGDMNSDGGMDISVVSACIKDENYSSALLVIREIQSLLKQAVEGRRLTAGNIL